VSCGVEIHHEAAQILILSLAADDGDGASIEIGGGEGIVFRNAVARLQDGARLAHDGAWSAGDDDVHMTQFSS
jgi:hypothetical protein